MGDVCAKTASEKFSVRETSRIHSVQFVPMVMENGVDQNHAVTLVGIRTEYMVKLEMLLRRVSTYYMQFLLLGWNNLNNRSGLISNLILIQRPASTEDPNVAFKLNDFVVKLLPFIKFFKILLLQ